MRTPLAVGIASLLALTSSCSCHQPTAPADDDDTTAPPVRHRVVAIGDTHGDLAAARTALQLAGAIDDDDHWIGGELVVVQTGDQIDRGDDDRAVLDLFTALAAEADAAGGAVYSLLGNHEVMNVELDLRYVSDASLEAFEDIEYDEADEELAALDEELRGRAAAFRPGGEYALMLAARDVVTEVDDVVFVHGGILSQHLAIGLDTINAETEAWMRAEREDEPEFLQGNSAPIWARDYSDEPDEDDCDELDEVLDAIPAQFMVVGHSRHDEITSACDGKVWLIDVGMAAYYGGEPAVLEILDGQEFTVLD
jgi:hypothetical protein